MEKDENKACKHCQHFFETEEYWHDHYLIPSHSCCRFYDKYNPKDVDPDGCCENFEKRDRRKNSYWGL